MKRYSPILLLALPLFGCGTTSHSTSNNEYAQPNALMAKEIDRRVQDISFQHRDELYNNLLWLAQRGESAVPSLLTGLQNAEPKVRSSCAWVLGRIGDRRTIQDLKKCINDPQETVRLEVARSLVEMGDVSQCPTLIAALDSEKVQVRAMVHEALKRATGRDFGFDHLSDNIEQRKLAVLRWRQWWGQLAGDPHFASQYAQQNQLAAPGAAPLGETVIPAKKQDVQESPQESLPPIEVQQTGTNPGTEPNPAPQSRPQPGGEIPR